jgi:hypothetical protein
MPILFLKAFPQLLGIHARRVMAPTFQSRSLQESDSAGELRLLGGPGSAGRVGRSSFRSLRSR